MDLTQLEKRAEQYFKKDVDVMYATEDGNFFYPEHKAFAEAHSSQQKVKLHKIEKPSGKSNKAAEKKESPKASKEPEKVEEKQPETPKTKATMQDKSDK